MLLFAICFNLWIYRLEPTAKIDPNDNTFQYALVDRTNQIWDYALKTCQVSRIKYHVFSFLTRDTCTLSLLVDHWVPNWAEGYNLPYYYSHIPQIAIVGSYRLFSLLFSTIQQYNNTALSLFQHYHFVIYLLLCFFPLSVFLALRITGLSFFTAGIGALLASHISTDGLYGLDPSSFLWRGYGLSSQLFAMIWLPLAIAYAYRLFSNDRAGDGKQLSRELAFWQKNENGNETFMTKRHLAKGNIDYGTVNSIRASRNNSFSVSLFPAVIFLTATTASHLGIGMIAFISIGILALSPLLYSLISLQHANTIIHELIIQIKKLFLLIIPAFLILGYWLIPAYLGDMYHNYSFWDPVWKFNSYGWKETLIRLFNGDLFDFGRFPIFTLFILVGCYCAVSGKNFRRTTSDEQQRFFGFGLLFVFWLLMYFGRTTWGGLLDIIPGIKEFHQSRFIVGLHLAGLFLAPVGLTWISKQLATFIVSMKRWSDLSLSYHSLIRLFVYLLICLFILPPIYQQTLRYNDLNNQLILRANTNYDAVAGDVTKLFTKLRSLPPGRIFTGRGGSYGKTFTVAETPYFIHLSTFGFPTTMWLPETWSPNSDIEQYFSEDQAKDYALYNIRYAVAPPNPPARFAESRQAGGPTGGEPVEPQPFWHLIDESKTWKLYEVDQVSDASKESTVSNIGYITTGVRPAVVASNKYNYINLVRLWIQSDYHKNGLYPQLSFDTNKYPVNTGLPNFKMLDEVTYQVPNGSTHNLFSEPPRYLSNIQNLSDIVSITSQNDNTDMVFRATVEVKTSCSQCLVILKETYHPSWQVTVDGKRAEVINVFPFYNAVLLDKPGVHEIVFSYRPSILKIVLIVISFISVIGLILIFSFQLCNLPRQPASLNQGEQAGNQPSGGALQRS